MTDRDRRERLVEYVAVLRGFGLSDAEILAVHDEETVPDGFTLSEFLDHRFDDADESTLYRRLHDALATSTPGIDADREYWAHAPPRQLDEACRYHGWRVDCSGDDPIAISVTTPDGETRESTFSYPGSEFGRHNYPALADAVARVLDGLTFALLTDRDGRWRFVLVETDHLAELRDRHGERVRVFRRPLLRAEQPADFAESATSPDDADRGSELAGVAGDAFAESVGTGPRVHRSSRPLDTEMDVSSGPETVVGEGIDEVFETLEASADDDQTDAPRAAASESVDDDVESLLSDLDEPTREEEAGGPTDRRWGAYDSNDRDDRDADADADADAKPTGSAGLVGGGPRTTVVENGLDDVFADLEGTNPPVRDGEPERMGTDDVLDAVDEEPTDPLPDSDDSAEPDSDTAVGDEEPKPDRPAEAESPAAPILDPDELTTPEDDGVESPDEPTDEEPVVSEDDPEPDAVAEPTSASTTDEDADAVPAADTVDTTVVEDDALDLPEPDADDEEPAAAESDAEAATAPDTEETAESTTDSPSEAPTEEADQPTDDPRTRTADDIAVEADALADLDAVADDATTEEPTDVADEPACVMDDSDDDAPAATPSIDEIELDVDPDDVPDVDEDEASSTAGPLAGGLGPDASAPEEPPEQDADEASSRPDLGASDDAISPDLLAEPDESALADAEEDDGYPDVVVGRLGENEESDRGPLGRLAAWVRNLF